MGANNTINQRQIGTPVPGDYGLYWDSADGTTKKFDLAAIAGTIDGNFEWVNDNAPGYSLDEVVTRTGKWYQSLIANNLNVVPGTDPTKWAELNKSSSGVFWRAGTYPEDKVVVFSDHTGETEVYELESVVRPYVSTDIEAEVLAGDWVVLSSIKEFANIAAFPAVGQRRKIYRSLDNTFLYAWDGSSYIQVGGSTNIYNLTSPTTIDVGNLAAGSVISGLTVAQILEAILTGSVPVVLATADSTIITADDTTFTVDSI